jgi:simple sugar transport system permease protein
VLSLILVIVALVVIAVALRGSSWGLRLKAMGKNLKAAFILGVPSEREAITGMMVAGALAGLGGAVRVLSWYDSLRQSIGGGIGFLAVLIVLLAGTQPILTASIALAFATLLSGGTTVQLRTQLHSALSGVIQGTLVLFVLLFGDYSRVFRKKADQVEVESSHE